jgi:hypothetical protein
MSPEQKNNTWQNIRDGISIGTFIFCLGILWQGAAFYTTVNNYMRDHKDKHVDIDNSLIKQGSEIEVLKQWKVATTGQPFRGNADATK